MTLMICDAACETALVKTTSAIVVLAPVSLGVVFGAKNHAECPQSVSLTFSSPPARVPNTFRFACLIPVLPQLCSNHRVQLPKTITDRQRELLQEFEAQEFIKRGAEAAQLLAADIAKRKAAEDAARRKEEDVKRNREVQEEIRRRKAALAEEAFRKQEVEAAQLRAEEAAKALLAAVAAGREGGDGGKAGP